MQSSLRTVLERKDRFRVANVETDSHLCCCCCSLSFFKFSSTVRHLAYITLHTHILKNHRPTDTKQTNYPSRTSLAERILDPPFFSTCSNAFISHTHTFSTLEKKGSKVVCFVLCCHGGSVVVKTFFFYSSPFSVRNLSYASRVIRPSGRVTLLSLMSQPSVSAALLTRAGSSLMAELVLEMVPLTGQ